MGDQHKPYVPMQFEAWLYAFRLRTLPLALSCIGMGGIFAAASGFFRSDIFMMNLFTAFFLQILSNLANDYGDAVHGADNITRIGPKRAVQSGIISKKAIKIALIVFVFLSLFSGVLLLWIALGSKIWVTLFFLILGISGIVAAVAYTMGKSPYGYRGLGDFFVFLFFGPVGMLGSLYLFTQSVVWSNLLPAISCGVFSTAVLNINNVRDMVSDRQAGKHSIPVRFGRRKAVLYHWTLLGIGLFTALIYVITHYVSPIQLLFLVVVPLLVSNGLSVSRKPLHELDASLKQMIFIILIFVLSFGIGLLFNTVFL